MCEKPILLLYCIILFCRVDLLAQQKSNYVFRHISQSDGLLHARINSIVQDSKGYIWILNPNGLQRYDGSRFVNYAYDVNNPNYISYTKDATLFSDKKNNCLWIMNGEIEKLELQKNKFIRYTAETIMSNTIFKYNSYTSVTGGQTWAGDFGVYKKNNLAALSNELFSTASIVEPGRSHLYMVDNANEEMWLCNWKGLTLFSKKTKTAYTHNYNPIHHPLLQLMDKKELRGILKDSRKNYWISTGNSLFYRYNAVTKKMSVYSLPDIARKNKTPVSRIEGVLIVNSFFEDNHHTIWIGTTNGGLLQYNAGTDSFTSIVNEENNKQGLHYNYEISCIFQDKEENIWLGTDKGINIFSPYRQHFQSIHHEEDNAASIPKNEIMNFTQASNGDIIAGTWGGGITVYDSKWNFKKNILFKEPYEYNLVWSFAQNDDGSTWTGLQHGFIHIYHPTTGAIQTIHPPELKNSTISCMTKDQQGNIWMGLYNGEIAEWNKKQNKFYGYNDRATQISQAYMPVNNIFFDSKQRCWVSTQKGFKQFDPEKRLYSAVYLQDNNNAQAISANFTEGIEEYDDSTLLIGTQHGGLNFFNPNNKTFSQLTTKDGLPANTIHAIKKDTEGYVWFTTDYDLYKFKPTDKKIIRFMMEPGIINTEFSTVSFYPLQDGRWLAGTAAEMICFYTKNNFSSPGADPKVEITGFKVFDKALFIDSSLDVNAPVKLPYQQNFLTIEFALLRFSNQQQTNYYYRLSDIDKHWVNSNSNNFASYTNLAPGEYTFAVKSGDENDETTVTSFKIIITPPFWKTTWFTITSIALSGLLIFWLFKRRIKTIRYEAALKQKVSETEMMALRAQMNPHFIFNCLNSIDNLIQENEKEKATLYLAKFARLIRAILENSQNNVVPCWKDMETLKLYLELEELRCDDKFTYSIHIAEEILNGDYKAPPLVIQPFVENAIHHGLLNKIENNRRLLINVTATNGHICYSIEDNGVGRVKANEYKEINKPVHKSMGMQITTDRINLFNQSKNGWVKITDIVDTNNEPAGTKVEVELINQS